MKNIMIATMIAIMLTTTAIAGTTGDASDLKGVGGARGIIYFDDSGVVKRDVDPFTNEVTGCNLYIGGLVWINIHGGHIDKLNVSGGAGSYDAAGVKFKIGASEAFQFGSKDRGDTKAVAKAPTGILSDILAGGSLIIVTQPLGIATNRWQSKEAISKTKMLSGSKAVGVFKRCLLSVK